MKTFCWLSSVSFGSWWAATVAAYFPGRMAEHLKSKSTGGWFSSTRLFTLYGWITFGISIIGSVLPRCRKENNVFEHPERAKEKPSLLPFLAPFLPFSSSKTRLFPAPDDAETRTDGQHRSRSAQSHGTWSNSPNLCSNIALLGRRDYDITEIDITESDVAEIWYNKKWYNGIRYNGNQYNPNRETSITESDITEFGITWKWKLL